MPVSQYVNKLDPGMLAYAIRVDKTNLREAADLVGGEVVRGPHPVLGIGLTDYVRVDPDQNYWATPGLWVIKQINPPRVSSATHGGFVAQWEEVT